MISSSAIDAPLLSIRGLTIRFGADSSRPATVDGIDLDIRPGEFVALVGESGSGKSLTAHTIAGILDPAAKLDADRLTLAGTDILANGWDQLRGSKVGI